MKPKIIISLLLLITTTLIAKPELLENFGDKELIPLFEKALSSITKNPIFYPHGMGYFSFEKLSNNLRKHGKMQKFNSIPLDKTWGMLSKIQQEKFKSVVHIEMFQMKRGKAIRNLNLSLVWKLSRSNPNVSAMCCGGACKIRIILGEQNNQPRVNLSIYKTNNIYDCRFGYSISYDTWNKYNREQWNKYHISGTLKDMNCDGNLPELKFNDNKIEKEFRKLYKEIFKSINPIKTLQHSPKEQCDV